MSLIRDEAITLAKDVLVEVPFNTIYSYADNLFDLDEMNTGDAALDDKIAFLKNTRLDQIQFDNVDDEAEFTLVNCDTRKSISVSNRTSSRNEIRGAVLRKILQQEKEKHPKKSVFNVISEAVKDPKYSDSIVMMRGVLTGENAKLLYGNESMSSEHFSAFSQMVLYAINAKIKRGEISTTLSPKKIREDNTLKNTILSGIDVAALYDLSHLMSSAPMAKFECHVDELKTKAKTLKARGYSKESELTKALAINLKEQHANLVSQKITKQEFLTSSAALIQEAKQSELKNIRGVGKIIFPILDAILNVLIAIGSLGIANLVAGKFSIFHKKSNALQKVNNIDDELQNIEGLTKSE